jgi:hypothetical protein
MRSLSTTQPGERDTHVASEPVDPDPATIAVAAAIALAVVVLTRLPVARGWAVESDEFGFLDQLRLHWFPMHHTLYLALGRTFGMIAGDPYRGLILLNITTSALALVSLWWFLRALAAPATAAAGALVLSVAPVFWGYGAIAGNYTAIIAVGAFLLGVAYRTRLHPAAWHPFATAVVFAFGTGYRQDIGTLWLPVFIVILWHHRWKRAALAGALFTALNLVWLLAMLHDAGGWSRYRQASADFAYHAGFLNSVWNLGFVDAPVRYAVKLSMALLWTLGPCLFFVPQGALRLRQTRSGGYLAILLLLTALPPLASHLLVHFGVPGYGFFYVPALLALVVLGIGGCSHGEISTVSSEPSWPGRTRRAGPRLLASAAFMASVFLFYPTDYDRPGWRGSFDLAFARHTRIGLQTPTPSRQPAIWRTANSRVVAAIGRRQ